MKIGDIVKFKEVVDAGDEELRMVVLEEDCGRVLVQALVGMRLNPTYRYNTQDFEVCSADSSTLLH